MYKFVACEKNDTGQEVKPELIQIFAVSRDEAVNAAKASGINTPVVRLANGVDPKESWAKHDARFGVLTIHLAPKEEEAIRYLQKEFGFRFRENDGYLSALWSPEREDGIRLDCAIQIGFFDGVGSRVSGTGSEYFSTVASQYLSSNPDALDSRAIWRKLQALKAEYARIDQGVDVNSTSSHLPSNLRALRVRNALSYRIRFLEELLHQSPVDVSQFPKLLKSGSRVKVDGQWLTVLRVNEKTVKVGPMNAKGGALVPLDEIEEIQLSEAPVDSSSITPAINPGDFVRYRGNWYRVSSITDDTVFVEGRTRVRAIGRHRITDTRTAEEQASR